MKLKVSKMKQTGCSCCGGGADSERNPAGINDALVSSRLWKSRSRNTALRYIACCWICSCYGMGGDTHLLKPTIIMRLSSTPTSP